MSRAFFFPLSHYCWKSRYYYANTISLCPMSSFRRVHIKQCYLIIFRDFRPKITCLPSSGKELTQMQDFGLSNCSVYRCRINLAWPSFYVHKTTRV